jgi:hypothetical protein
MVRDLSGTNADVRRHVLDGLDEKSAIQRIRIIDLHSSIWARRGECACGLIQFGDQSIRTIQTRARSGERWWFWHDDHRTVALMREASRSEVHVVENAPDMLK